MQVVRLPDWKLVVYISAPFVLEVALLAVIESVDPLRPSQHTKHNALQDEYYYYCGTGTTGLAIVGTVGGLTVGGELKIISAIGWGGVCCCCCCCLLVLVLVGLLLLTNGPITLVCVQAVLVLFCSIMAFSTRNVVQ